MKPSYDFEQLFSTKADRNRPPLSRPRVPSYRVGEALQRGRRQWPVGAQYAYGPHGHELTLFQADIDDRTVDELRRGEAEFAVIVDAPVIVMAYRFADVIPWSDVPYCWHTQSPAWRVIPPLTASAEHRALLWITLVSSDDGIIRAQRGMTLCPKFTRTLHDAIRVQATTPFNPHECMAAVSQLFLTRSSTLDRLSLASARTIGNT